MGTLMEESRELDRRLNAATDPEEMKALITRRRLVRAGLDFDHAMEELERTNPVPAAIPDPFPFRPAGPDPDPSADLAEDVAWLRAVRAEVAARQAAIPPAGLADRPRCLKCGAILDVDGADRFAHNAWCLGCSFRWVERRILEPLVRRLGEREARKALARLVRAAKRRRESK